MEIVIIIVFAAIIIVGAIYANYQNRQRIAALQALAARRGWTFSDAHDDTLETRYPDFNCLRAGSNRYAYNRLGGKSGDYALAGFDYHHETYSTDSDGKRKTHDHYFSAIVVDTSFPLKPLLIRTETFMDKVGEFFGVDDIDFESDEFNRKFFVKGVDRRWAFDVINQATMEFLLAAPRFTIQFAGGSVIAFRDELFAPDEFEQAEQVVRGILDRLPKYLLEEWKGAHR